jgi:hypothetical protein
MSRYSYEQCLAHAYKVNWRIEDVLGGRDFDPGKRWLPHALSGADGPGCLDDEERRKLTHVEMAAYAHIFGYVEEFIAPLVVELARESGVEQRTTFDALANFAAEEVKHMNLFRRIRDRIDGSLGFGLELLGGQQETARFVLGRNRGAVLLLTAFIEWFTQRHYLECFDGDEHLDPLTRRVFKCHWQEEAQHARMDHLETLRAFGGMNDAEREQAVDHLIELVGAVDGLLRQQAGMDVRNLQGYLGRTLDADEQAEVEQHVLAAKRHAFLEMGVTHPRFQELFAEVTTPAQQERVGAALAGLLPAPALA